MGYFPKKFTNIFHDVMGCHWTSLESDLTNESRRLETGRPFSSPHFGVKVDKMAVDMIGMCLFEPNNIGIHWLAGNSTTCIRNMRGKFQLLCYFSRWYLRELAYYSIFPNVIVQSSAAIVTTLLAIVLCPNYVFETPKKKYAASF